MIEKCADELDMASQREVQNRDQELERQRRDEAARVAATKAALAEGTFDGKHCIEEDCGEELPALRLAEHRMLCTSCQARRETQRKQRGLS